MLCYTGQYIRLNYGYCFCSAFPTRKPSCASRPRVFLVFLHELMGFILASIMSSEFGFQLFQPSMPMEGSLSNVSLSRALAVPSRHNFLSFLTTAQALNIALLPITWQSAWKAIGHGGTSRINQASTNIQMTLAFKQVKDDEKLEKLKQKSFKC